MLCHRNCGLPATYTNYKGAPCCAKSASHCPTVKEKIGKNSGESRKGKPLTDECRANMSAARQGKSTPVEVRTKIKRSNVDYWVDRERIPWNKGKTGVQIPWNKGMVGQYTLPPRRTLTENEFRDYAKYKRAVYTQTRKTLQKYSNEINPSCLPIGRHGQQGAYQIDHKIPISVGYANRIDPKTMAIPANLQILSWEENAKKTNTLQECHEALLATLIELTSL